MNRSTRSLKARHAKADVKQKELKGYTGKAYLGMDAGSNRIYV